MKRFALLLLILGITGCKDRGLCLSSHTVVMEVPNYIYVPGPKGQVAPMFVGFLQIPTVVCDKWEYPDGTTTQVKR